MYAKTWCLMSPYSGSMCKLTIGFNLAKLATALTASLDATLIWENLWHIFMAINFFIYVWWMMCSRLCIIVGWDLEERALMLFKAD